MKNHASPPLQTAPTPSGTQHCTCLHLRSRRGPTQCACAHTRTHRFYILPFLPCLKEGQGQRVKSKNKNLPYCPPVSSKHSTVIYSFVKKNEALHCYRGKTNSRFSLCVQLNYNFHICLLQKRTEPLEQGLWRLYQHGPRQRGLSLRPSFGVLPGPRHRGTTSRRL